MPAFLRTTFAAISALGLLACTSLHANEPQVGDATRYVHVDGIATIQVIPDVVDMSMTLTAEHGNPRQAVAALRKQQAALLSVLPEAAGSDAEISAGQLRLSTDWRSYRDRREAPVHSASMTVVVSLSALDRMGEILAVGTEHGVTAASSRYRSTQLPEKKKEVRELALRAATEKAQQSVALMGAQLGPVISIEEVSSRQGGWGSVSNNYVVAPTNDPSADGALIPGALDLSLTVEVRYALL